MPLPTYSSDLPEHATGRSIVFYLVLLPMGFSLPRPLPCVRCALTTPFHPYPQGAVCFLCHFPSSYDAYPLDSIAPCEARTFLPILEEYSDCLFFRQSEIQFYHILKNALTGDDGVLLCLLIRWSSVRIAHDPPNFNSTVV